MKRLLFSILIAAALVGMVFAPASTVMAASGTRSLPSSVTAGGNFDVDINTADYGAFGQVEETLPAGFSYVGCDDLSEAAVDVDGQEVKFTLLGETVFSYTVKASSTAGTYTFSGILKDEDRVEYALAGQAQIMVPATRSLPSSVTAGRNFDVDINTADYGAFGQVVETLPAGFSYVGCDDLSEAAVTVAGQVVKFTLLEGDTAFTYTVKASSTAGTYPFSGILKDVDKVEYAIGGNTEITVTRRSGGGGGGGGAPTYYTETNLFGVEKSYRIDSDGEILATIEATSEDSLLTMTIPKGTIALGKDGKRLKSLQTAVDESPPDPAEDTHIIALAYDFGPDGATFDPEITLVWSYDPDALPEDVAEEDLVVAYYAGEWVEVDCVVDTENDTITASVEHFTTFAIIGAVTPPPPPPPAPAEFSVSNLSVTQLEVEPKEAVAVTVSVANTGGIEGSYTVVLKINGVKEAEKTAIIAAGSSLDVSFTVTKEDAGSYSVTVDGLSASFTVVAPVPPEEEEVAPPEEEELVPEVPAPINWPVLGGIIAAVVVLGLLIYFLVVRRRAA